MRSTFLAAAVVLSTTLFDGALARSPSSDALPTPWTAWNGGWVRREADGNLSCLSRDATHCAWNSSVSDPKVVSRSQVRPLVCGTPHKRSVWGVTGYNDGDDRNGNRHWCRSAYGTLFVEWQDYSVLGFKVWLAETPAGDAMCHSTDGKHCTPVTQGASAPPPGAEVHPLVCGAHHRRMWGNEGYDQPGHWCKTPRIVKRLPNESAIEGLLVNGVSTPSWIADDEPAVVVQASLPDKRALLLFTEVLLSRTTPTGLNRMMVGGVVGDFVAMHAQPNNARVHWRRSLSGPQTFGFKVTPNQHLCFFRTAGLGQSGDFFGSSALLWNSRQVAAAYAQRELLIKSSIPAPTTPGPATTNAEVMQTPRILWQASDGAPIRLNEVLLLAARRVPVEGDLTGKKRKVSYAEHCDDNPSPPIWQH